MLALASPASLKGVFSPLQAASLVATGMRRVSGLDVEEAPVADGGEGTAAVIHAALGGTWHTAVVSDALGRPVAAEWLLLDDGTAVVESAQAIGLPLLQLEERDPLRTTSLGVGELLLATLAAKPTAFLVCVGGTATVDGGIAMRAVLGSWLREIPVRVLCDVRSPLLGEHGAARVFGPQKGAMPDVVDELEARLAGLDELAPYRNLPGAGAGGGLGAAFAALGGELVEGAELVLDTIGFDERARGADLVVTGEGTVDASTFEGKAPGAVVRRCERLGVRCELFGGIVRDGIDAHALSGRRALVGEDLLRLGEDLAVALR
ncbi:MAG TPA: glycerate kinase [Gaiellaceae bacterium]|nr:glycerate kinase [Gaiellaceae bacterium]